MAGSRRSNLLIRGFRSLMPREEQFIERFSQHSQLIVPAAEAFRALMSGDGQAEQHATELGRLENAADQITRDTVLAIHRTFVTPFDRSQILDLITALDDTIDLMKETGRRMLECCAKASVSPRRCRAWQIAQCAPPLRPVTRWPC